MGLKLEEIKNLIKESILVRTGYGVETEKLLNRFTYKKLKAKTKVYDDLRSFVQSLDNTIS